MLASFGAMSLLRPSARYEVFFCSGQSNMELPLSVIANASAEIASLGDAAVAKFRFCVTGTATAEEPQWDLPGSCAADRPGLRPYQI